MPALYKLPSNIARTASPGKHEDGGGLRLVRRQDGGGQWVLRITVHGRRREMGLGALSDVSLKEARDEADKWRSFARKGGDPISERDRLRREARGHDSTFASVAQSAFEARQAELKGDGKNGRWMSPLDTHVLPKIGKRPVSEIDQRELADLLRPIWHKKASAAQKALSRTGIVMRHAAALGLEVDLQAVPKARELLGKQRHTITHTPAVPWQDVPAFYKSLDDGGVTHLSLRLLILTAVRSHPLRHIQADQIEGDVWTVPAERQKGTVGQMSDFRVPLSTQAQELVSEARKFERRGFLFPGLKKGVISDVTWTRLMDRRGMIERPHGFRSSFRTWVSEATGFPRELGEMALSHVIGSKVERSYERTDFLEQRRELMQAWADWVVGANKC